jgi:MFS family permease
MADVRDGWRAIAADRLLALVAVQATVAATLLLVLLSLLPGLVSRTLALGVEDAPYIILAGGAAFLLGAAWIGRRGDRLDPGVSVGVGLLGVGVGTVLLALVAGPGWQRWASVAAIAGVGLALSAVVIPARVALQRRPPAALRARVIGAQLALANAASVLPLLLGGAVADWLGIRPVMVALGIIALLAGAAGLAVVRRQRVV